MVSMEGFKLVKANSGLKSFSSSYEKPSMEDRSEPFFPAFKNREGGENMASRSKPKKLIPRDTATMREFVECIKTGDLPAQYVLPSLKVNYKYRLVAWSKDRIVVNISRFAPSGGWQSWNINVTKLAGFITDLIYAVKLLERNGILPANVTANILEEIKLLI